MNLTYEHVLTSRPFRFLIGDGKKEYVVHEALIAHQSQALLALVSGSMSEAKKGYAWIEDVDEQTFVRVCEYLYTGDYRPAEPLIVLDTLQIQQEGCSTPRAAEALPDCEPPIEDSVPVVAEPAEDNSDLHWGSFVPKKKKKSTALSKRDAAWSNFQQLRFETDDSENLERANQEPCEEYTNVFLSHAQVYTFADKYGVEKLKALSLSKLHSVLTSFTLYQERTGDVSALFQYTYEHTCDRSGQVDSLRSLVIQYIACVVEQVARNEIFRKVLTDENRASSDLIECLVFRLD